MRIETNHLISVSAEFGDLTPCEKAEECRRWASGSLNLVIDGDHKRFNATACLTAAGCEVCPDYSLPTAEQSVYSAHGDGYEVGVVEVVSHQIHTAQGILGIAAEKIPKR